MTARNCRYCGSGAVMMSELVATSACTWPPVADKDEVAAAPPVAAGAGEATAWAWPVMAARRVAASLTASAFLR